MLPIVRKLVSVRQIWPPFSFFKQLLFKIICSLKIIPCLNCYVVFSASYYPYGSLGVTPIIKLNPKVFWSVVCSAPLIGTQILVHIDLIRSLISVCWSFYRRNLSYWFKLSSRNSYLSVLVVFVIGEGNGNR